MQNGSFALSDERTDRDSSANEAGFADHLLSTILDRANVAAIEAASETFGRHVVDFIGEDKPWDRSGRVAIQKFRCDPCTYFIGGKVGAIKIGYTIAPLERLATMQMGSPISLAILALVQGGVEVEKAYHRQFATHRQHGEWFARHPDILAEIERIRASASTGELQ